MSILDIIMSFFQKEITVNEGINLARQDQEAIILDIRPKDSYKRGYVPGAINIPLEKIDAMAKNRIRNQNAPIYVVGGYGTNPHLAVKKLKKLGYTKVICSGRMEEHHGLLKTSK